MSKVLTIIVCIILLSCGSLKWKYNYIGTKLESMKKYYNDTAIELTIPNELGVNKNIKKMTRNKIRKIMYKLEKGAAMIPDSLVENKGRFDSIYYNPDKIQFIKKNLLLTSNIRF